MSRPLSALAVALLVTLSVFAGVAGVAAGAQSNGQGGPPGHASIPDHAVSIGQGQQAPPGPTDASAWAPSAGEHASDMTVEVRSPRADDRLELVFGDEQNHAGREVAVSTHAIRDALGKTPQVAYVTHESGDRYAVPLENNGETLSWTLHEFSENTVTFEGEVSIQGSPATDGAQYQYDLSDLSSVSNYSIDVTGSTATAWSNQSAAGIDANGSSQSLNVGGNLAPTGPSVNGNPVLEVTGHGGTASPPNTDRVDWGYMLYQGNDFAEARLDNPPETIDEITVNISSVQNYYVDSEIRIAEGTPDQSVGGTVVVSNHRFQPGDSGNITIPLDSAYSPSQNTITVEFVSTGYGGTDAQVRVMLGSSTGTGETWYYDDYFEGAIDQPAEVFATQTTPENVTADADDGTSASIGNLAGGETKTVEFPVSTSATSLSWSGSGTVDYSLRMEERTQTQDPTIEVNGNTTSYTGSLADGSTTSLATDASWLQEGTNRVNVSLAAPSSGPTPQVGLDYRHDATSKQNTSFDGETWAERYNISRTFGADQNAATLTVPFASDRVVGIRDVQHRVDGGSWQSVSQHSLDGTELTVELGDVLAGETHEVRAVGTKVQVTDGAITVLDPTFEGNTLDSEVRVDSAGSQFQIDVSGTEPSRFVHYTVEESWQGTPFASVAADGSQELHMAPPDGATMRVRTIPVETYPESGRVSVIVEDGAEPRFTLQDHSSDVNVTYHDTIGGETYALIDAETGEEVMRDTAQSPVHFWAPDGKATYLIDLASSTGSGSTGDVAVAVANDSPLSTLAIFVGLAGSIVGFVFVGRRFGARGWRQNLGLVVGGVAVAIVAIEAVTAGSFLGELAAGGGAIVGGALGGFINSGAGAVASGIGMFWAVYAVYSRFGLPQWVLIPSSVAIGVFVLDNITGGALSGGLAQVSALLWLGIVFGAIALLWRVLQPRPIQIRGS